MIGFNSTNNPDRSDALTGARFFAALLVLFYHRGLVALKAVSPLLAAPAEIGLVSVGFFYVLSGFVLTLAYHRRTMDRRTFYLNRFSRVYPLYLLALVLSLPGFLLKWHSTEIPPLPAYGALLLAPTLLQSWIPATALAWNGPGWSLSCEAFFYLLFPLILPRVMRLKWKGIAITISALWLASVLPGILFHAKFGFNIASAALEFKQQVSFWSALIAYNPLIRLPEFIAGMVLAKIALSVALPQRRRLFTIAGVLCLALAVAGRAYLPELILHNGLLLPAWMMLIVGLYWRAWPARMLEWTPVVFLGEISYGIYVLQSPVSGYLGMALRPLLHRPFVAQYPDMISLGIYVAVLTFVAAVSYRYFELPVREWIKKDRRNGVLIPRQLTLSIKTPSAFETEPDLVMVGRDQ